MNLLVNRDEFPQLKNKIIYLDNAGSALYNKTHVNRYSELLKNTFLTNPHSGSDDESSSIELELKFRN